LAFSVRRGVTLTAVILNPLGFAFHAVCM
jgi:hypothetical protein